MSFDDIAEERLLPAAKTHLGELTWDVEATGYLRLTLPPEPPLEPLFALFARRTLVPAFASTLLDVFPDRPMERALIAYDVAASSLLGRNDTALVERIAKQLVPLRKLGPATPVAIPSERVPALLDAVLPPLDAEPMTNDFASLPSLAALAQLTRVRETFEDDSSIVKAILRHVKVLSHAHLPSLGIAFLQILWNRFAVREARDLMVELAVDHDMIHVLPKLGEDDQSMQLQTYLLMRWHMANFNLTAAERAYEENAKSPAVRDSKDPRLLVACVELALHNRKPIDDSAVKIIDELGQGGWRYAYRVHCAIRMAQDPTIAHEFVDHFVTQYGNNAYIWAHAADHEEARAGALTLLSREVRYASHDPNVWRALSILVKDGGEEIGAQLDQRMLEQLGKFFALGAPTDHIRQLETFLSTMRNVKSGQPTYDQALQGLEALVAKLRAEAPDEVQAWADAHDGYLAWVIADHVMRDDAENANVERALRDRAEWTKVRAGAATFVDETIDYAPASNEQYRTLFGIDLKTPL